MLLVDLVPDGQVEVEQLSGCQRGGEGLYCEAYFFLVGGQLVVDGGGQPKGCFLAVDHELELELVESALG